jgi:hypothetical protein
MKENGHHATSYFSMHTMHSSCAPTKKEKSMGDRKLQEDRRKHPLGHQIGSILS